MEVGKEHLYTELREREGVMPGTAKLDGVRVSCFQHLNKWEPHNWRATDNDDYDRNKHVHDRYDDPYFIEFEAGPLRNGSVSALIFFRATIFFSSGVLQAPSPSLRRFRAFDLPVLYVKTGSYIKRTTDATAEGYTARRSDRFYEEP
ncbi:MAG: hypothetical protein LQ343_006001 [Gyalolechia ehrenbergii]|nr:MAG: hypothetical protein LQ343_006001 [Gyalolechia ehrenbergii]